MSKTKKIFLARLFLSHHFFPVTRTQTHFKNHLQDWKEMFCPKLKGEYWCEYYWGAGTFRGNHKMWLPVQDTTISYLIARNPRLKKTNSFQSTFMKSLCNCSSISSPSPHWKPSVVIFIVIFVFVFVFFFVISSLSPGTWRGECPAWPCLPGWVSLPVGAKVASSPHRPDNQRDMMCDRI